MEPRNGILLLSDPFLKDPNFKRTAILLCEYNEQGAFGLVLNRPIPHRLGELVDAAAGIDYTVYSGGPVEKNTLHFLHQRPDLIHDGLDLGENIYWGGDFEMVLQLIRSGELPPQDIRFYVGYSGWSEGQLEEEIQEKSWILAPSQAALLFQPDATLIWRQSMQTLGGEYAQMPHYPADPQLN